MLLFVLDLSSIGGRETKFSSSPFQHTIKTNRKYTCYICVWVQWWTRRPSDTGRKVGGERWGHCLWLTQGGSAFKSLHHLHWFPFLRSRGFKDLHSCDVKREKWGRNSRTRAGDGAFLLHAPLSSPTASSLPVTQARQKAERGFVRLDSASVIKLVNFCTAGPGMYVNVGVCHYNPCKKPP